jgi:hypothetical protein
MSLRVLGVTCFNSFVILVQVFPMQFLKAKQEALLWFTCTQHSRSRAHHCRYAVEIFYNLNIRSSWRLESLSSKACNTHLKRNIYTTFIGSSKPRSSFLCFLTTLILNYTLIVVNWTNPYKTFQDFDHYFSNALFNTIPPHSLSKYQRVKKMMLLSTTFLPNRKRFVADQ